MDELLQRLQLSDNISYSSAENRKRLKNSICPHIALVIAQLLFSGYQVLGSIVLSNGTADPVLFSLYRALIAVVVLYSIVRYANVPIEIESEDYYRFIALGFFSCLNVVGNTLALQYISATRFSIFQPSVPCIATMVSIILGMEAFTLTKLVGITLSVGGAVMVETWHANSSNTSEANIPVGSFVVAVQCTSLALLIVLQKPLTVKYNTKVVTFVYYTVGTVFVLLVCLGWVAAKGEVSPAFFALNYDETAWLVMMYSAALCTAFSYNAIGWASKLLSPSLTTLYCTIQPIGTILLSLVILNSMITVPEGVGTAMVIVGLFITVSGQYEMNFISRIDYSNVSKEEVIKEGMKTYPSEVFTASSSVHSSCSSYDSIINSMADSRTAWDYNLEEG